jgi:hypothetical protein
LNPRCAKRWFGFHYFFEGVAKLGLPQGYTEIMTEINAASETISVIIRVQGFAGWAYSYWILRKAGG